jgi:CRP-like cAMP-binding protein
MTDKIELEYLLNELERESAAVEVGKSETLDFVTGDKAFLILEGEVVAFSGQNAKTGMSRTITLGKHDPIGFAEAIVSKPPSLRYVTNTEVKLLEVDAVALRKAIAGANILAATIIRYIVARIFKESQRSKNYLFEDEFIERNRDIFLQAKFAEGEQIFTPSTQIAKMFFIRSGTVEISTSDGIVLGALSVGECFGEAALLSDRKRKFTATAITKVHTIVIEKTLVLNEIKKNTTLVQLTALVLLKRMDIMNLLRLEKSREV